MFKPRALSLLLVLPLAFCSKKEETPPAPTPTVAESSTAVTSTTSATTATAATTSSAAPPPAPTATAPATVGIASADGDTPGVTVAVKELKRTSGDTVSLKFVITNGSSKQLSIGYDFGDPDHHIGDYDSVGGITLLDPVGKKKYFVARDSSNKCVCSQGLKDISPGSSTNGWAKFPAPPDGVDKISIVIPHFGPMDDVPISK